MKNRINKKYGTPFVFTLFDLDKEALKYPNALNFAYICNHDYNMSIDEGVEIWNKAQSEKNKTLIN